MVAGGWVSQVIELLEETPDYLVVNKPPGLVSQGAERDGNLLSLLRVQLSLPEIFPVHRLDAPTSGVMVLGKTAHAVSVLSTAFRERQVDKRYLALVDRRPRKKQGAIVGDMERARNGNWRLRRRRDNPAITHFVSSGLGNGRRLVVLRPQTGKTHQLRVAMKSLAAPIVGDDRYGGTRADRLYLHAWHLAFNWEGCRREYRADSLVGKFFCDREFRDKLAALGGVERLQWPGDS